MKILLYRTIRPEEMGYVVDDIVSEYGEDCQITVLTRPENKTTMKAIKRVNEVMTYSNHVFEFNKQYLPEIVILKKQRYDKAIIPTNGNLESYQNVVKFNKETFGNVPIEFYKYPSSFITAKKSIRGIFLSFLFKVLSFILTFPILLLYLFTVSFFYLINVLRLRYEK